MVKVKVVAVSGDRMVEVKAIALCSDNFQGGGSKFFWGPGA